MTDIIIFGGTTEGRMLSELMAGSGAKVCLCVATEHGEGMVRRHENMEISHQRLGGADGIASLIRDRNAGVVVDATHPYALVISRNIKKACAATGAEHMRLVRAKSVDPGGKVIYTAGIDEAIEYLRGTEGNILVTTGSKELAKYTAIDNYRERVFARVLSLPEVAVQCGDLGFKGRNLICMQGPFNEDINYGMIRQFNIEHMVTKDSGEPGGFGDKIRAAERAGIDTVIIGRPEEDGLAYGSVVNILAERFGLKLKKSRPSTKKNIWVIGAGMGNAGGMTVEAAEACRNADAIIGPKRVTDLIAHKKNVLNEYRPEKVISYIQDHPELNNIAVVFSGDIGFYSGAKKLIDALDKKWNIIPLCGISSVVYLCSKLMVPWQDVRLLNAHAAEPNIVGEIKRNGKVFCLLTKGSDITALCEKLISYRMNNIRMTVGEKLGYHDERIVTGRPKDIMKNEFDDLSVILVVNDEYDRECPISIPDSEFIRGNVPMTKSEVRALTVSKLKLSDDSVIYDVGAGTGSVSVEMARVAVNGKVYAIEFDKEALDLIRKNRTHFAADNITIISGKAPEVLADLPAPTHAFIGGSGGHLMDIMKTLKEKNPYVKVIINSVTLETTYEALRCIKELGMEETETICISVSKAKAVGRSHLMTAQNPVYMTVCRGTGE
ncbi:MAG: precorrin-6A reductase [Methanomassiliicoccaceae archaeon]|jgi:precorrin-6Y C5,15-methyltransferase (decarboxylating)|nr:precorrin-6A reductase [Methanomassiliicoccaceae archaeon]